MTASLFLISSLISPLHCFGLIPDDLGSYLGRHVRLFTPMHDGQPDYICLEEGRVVTGPIEWATVFQVMIQAQ